MTERLNSFSKLEFDKILARISSLTATELGKSMIERMQPCASLEEVETALTQVSEMKMLIQANLSPSFDGVTDCRSIIRRSEIQENALTAPELRAIKNLLIAARKIKAHLRKHGESCVELRSLTEEIETNRVLEFNIESTITEQDEIRDNASKNLRTIRYKLRELRETLRCKLEVILRSAIKNAWAQDEILTTREGRMVIPVKVEHKHHIPGFVHNTSASGATVFIEPVETLEINNEIRSLLFEEEREIQQILRILTSQVRSNAKILLDTIEVIGLLDTIYARARYSLLINGSKPSILSVGPIVLEEVRHPLLIEHLGYERVVPLNIEMGKNYHTIVISGPNAGGKSVVLKAVGLTVVMVHHGIHAPLSSDSKIPFISQIFVDLGDEQSIEGNLSTFTSHLVNLKDICESADASTLVLIDEICAGTDPTEAGALAVAILKRLSDLKSFNLITTHNSLLKAFVQQEPDMINASMEFDHNTLSPTYRLRIGTVGTSYALEIAGRLNFDAQILNQARIALGEKGDRQSKLLADLELKHSKLKKELETLEIKERKLNELIRRYEFNIKEIDKQKKQWKKEAIAQARDILEQSRSRIENVIKEIREKNANPEVIHKARREIQKEEENLVSLEHSIDLHEGEPKFAEGQLVRFRENNTIGEILKCVDNENVLVLFNQAKILARKDQLQPVATQPEHETKHNSAINPTLPHRPSVDVRGMVAHEAVAVIDKSLDTATLADQRFLKIIHGKGSGSLSRKIQAFLSQHHQVKSFRYGEWNEGGLGVTIVELK